MKKLLALTIAVILGEGLSAQVPEKMSYQAVVRNTAGELVKNSPVGMKISILQGSESGTAVYVETHTKTTNENGLVTLEIGGGTIVTGTFAGTDWSAGTFFLKTETDPTGGTSYTIIGTSQMLSVPYALFAKNAGNIDALLLRIELLEWKKVVDIDGNIYNTVSIGDQIWMAENLKTTKFRNGTPILLVTSSSSWDHLSSPAYCWYNNDINNKNLYGALYNWYTANTYNLCPKGWHVPTDSDWSSLTSFLGGVAEAGGKIKEAGLLHWSSPNTGATNESGFTALPTGSRNPDGSFEGDTYEGLWWATSSDQYEDYAYFRAVFHNTSQVIRGSGNNGEGFSVRCIKD